MSELQGPRLPGEEGSGRRKPIGWIVAGLVVLLLLALLIPLACQALTGGSDQQGGASGSQENTSAQDSGVNGGEMRPARARAHLAVRTRMATARSQRPARRARARRPRAAVAREVGDRVRGG